MAIYFPVNIDGMEGLLAIPIGFIVAAIVLRFYTNFKQNHWFVNTLAFLTFGGTFFIIFHLLIDIASTGYIACIKDPAKTCTQPLFYDAQVVMATVWTVFYIVTIVCCWVLIPICQSFLFVGGTRFLYRLKWAFIRQGIYYSIVGTIGLISLIYIIATFNQLKLNTFIKALSNCWGLVLLVIFMGFGIVEIPRRLWKKSNSVKRLTYLELKTPKLREELLDSEHEYRENVNLLVNIADNIDSSHVYYNMVQQILNSPEVSLNRNNIIHNSQARFPSPLTEGYIATIHRKIKQAGHCRRRNQTLWNDHLETTFFVQDIVNNLDSSDRKLTSSLKVLSGSKFDDYKLTILWWWYVMIYPILLKALAIILSIMGAVIVWSEMTLAARNPVLSIVALLFEAISDNYALQNFFALIFLSYMTVCTFFALLNVKLFNYYVIVPNGQTDGISLLWVGNNMLRLIPALFFNFLKLGQIGVFEKQPLVFIQFFGDYIDSAPVLGKNMSNYFPCIILVPVALVFFNLHIKFARLFSLEDFFYEADTFEGRTLEGKSILATERSKRERQFQFDSRDSHPSNIPSRSIDIEEARFTPDSDDNGTAGNYFQSQESSGVLNNIRNFFNWNRITLRSSPSNVSLRSDHSDEYEQFIVSES